VLSHRAQGRAQFFRSGARGSFEQWDDCVNVGDCKHKPGDPEGGRGQRPVVNVSWDKITKESLPWLNSKTGRTYRLLSEAEWEFCRTRWNDDALLHRADRTSPSKLDRGHSVPPLQRG
jgi:formylglycine-generating enzyme required for sulfatase activity